MFDSAAAEALPSPWERQRRLNELLRKGSRTFALTIPLLPPPLQEAMTVAYLLMRAADTLEDTEGWRRERRIALLTEFSSLLRKGLPSWEAEAFAARLTDLDAIDDPGHRDVLVSLGFLAEQLHGLPEPFVGPILEHCDRMAGRMMGWVGAHDERGRLALRRLRELDDYCYAVAGIVGEMITELVEAHDPHLDERVRLELHATATDFGVGLQLTNILKDCWRDAQAGRCYVPLPFLPDADGSGAERLDPLLDLAWDRLSRGIRYTRALPVELAGVRRFCLLPLLLAGASLREVRSRSAELFAGEDVKISRLEVARWVSQTHEHGEDDDAINRLWAELAAALEAAR